MKVTPKRRVIEIVKRITVEQKVCPQCGKKFEGAKVAQFCSKSCANKASYARHNEDARKRRREKYQQDKLSL